MKPGEIITKGNNKILSNQQYLQGSKFFISDKYKLAIVPNAARTKQYSNTFVSSSLNLECKEFVIKLFGLRKFKSVTKEKSEI